MCFGAVNVIRLPALFMCEQPAAALCMHICHRLLEVIQVGHHQTTQVKCGDQPVYIGQAFTHSCTQLTSIS